MKFPMMVAGLGTLLNTILDPIFIFKLEDYGNIGFGMGVKGAAMATVFLVNRIFNIYLYALHKRPCLHYI